MTRHNKPGFYRRQLYHGGQNRCHWCGIELEPYEATLDHVIPLASGGQDRIENMTIACDNCNQIRGLVQQVVRGKVKCATKNSIRQVDGWTSRFAGKDRWLSSEGRLAIVKAWIIKQRGE